MSQKSDKKPADLEDPISFVAKLNTRKTDKERKENLPWQATFEEEKKSILQRRRVAFDNIAKPNGDEVKNLTGLSLSGGGIRSALFNDGFLQAISHHGLLRYVDYLSMVSGGGYIGGHLVSCGVLKEHEQPDDLLEKMASNAADSSASRSAFEEQVILNRKSFHIDPRFWTLGKVPDTGQVDPNRFPNIGAYLARSSEFVARYFATQLFVFLWYIGLVGLFAAAIAIFWRTFDAEDFRIAWAYLGLDLWGFELALPFYPTIWIAVLWVPMVFLRFFGSVTVALGKNIELPTWVTIVYSLSLKALGFLFLMSVLIGIAVALGNSLTGTESNILFPDSPSLNNYAEILAIVAGITQLALFLVRDRIFRSEQGSAKSWQRMLAGGISISAVVVVPFAMIHWMAQEDFSNYTSNRDPHLIRHDIVDWNVISKIQEVANSTRNEKLSTLNSKYEALVKKQSDYEELWAKYVSPSRWQRYEPGGGLTPPNPLRVENTKLTVPSQTARCVNFFKVSGYLICKNCHLDFIFSPFKELETEHEKLHCQQNQYLKEFNEIMGNGEFLVALLESNSKVNRPSGGPLNTLIEKRSNLIEIFLSPASDQKSTYATSPTAVFEKLRNHKGASDIQKMRLASRIQLLLQRDLEDGGTPGAGDNSQQSSTDKQSKGSSEPTAESTDIATDSTEEKKMLAKKWAIAAETRRLLELMYPDAIKPISAASTPTVVVHDQNSRWHCMYFFAVLTLLGWVGTINYNWQNSLFQFYKNCLSHRFLQGWFAGKVNNGVGDSIALSDCDVTRVGLPYPLAVGTWMERRASGPIYFPFIFSPKKVGITDRYNMADFDQCQDVQNTDDYCLHGHNRKLELGDAIAISGAAVTPFMTRHIGLAVILDFFGLGLGQWMHRPSMSREKRWPMFGYLYQVYQGLARLIPTRENKKRLDYGFVADGGYEDVLGAYELLRRRCELIIVSDACTNTNQDELAALAKLLEAANTNLGIQFIDLDHEAPIDFARLLKNDDGSLPQNHIMMRVRYPSDEHHDSPQEGLLIYLQMGITQNDPIEIQQIKKKFPAFPDEPTSNQFYTPEQVLAYQKLGYYIGKKICGDLIRWEPDDILAAEKHRVLHSRNTDQTDSKEINTFIEREFYGSRKNGELQKKANEIQIEPNAQPLFDVVKNRLLGSYRLACFEEVDYTQTDIFSEAVWDRNEWCFISLRNCVKRDLSKRIANVVTANGFDDRLKAVQEVCAHWVQVFETNADVAAVYRNIVFFDVNGGMLSAGQNRSRSVEVFQQLKGMLAERLPQANISASIEAAVLSAHFSAIAVACQQFHRGLPRAIFQVGGLSKLLDLMTSLFFCVKKTSNQKLIRPNLPPNTLETDCEVAWTKWLSENSSEIVELRTGVFNSSNVESTVSFTQVLLLHLQTWQKTDFPLDWNHVMIRKRLFDAVQNFGIGEPEKIRSLDQIVDELFAPKKTHSPPAKSPLPR